MQELHFPEHILIPWCIDLQSWISSDVIPHLQRAHGKGQGSRGDSLKWLLSAKPREWLCFCSKCVLQIFWFAFRCIPIATEFIIFVLKEREKVSFPKSSFNNNSLRKTVLMRYRIPYGILYLFREPPVPDQWVFKKKKKKCCFKIQAWQFVYFQVLWIRYLMVIPKS